MPSERDVEPSLWRNPPRPSDLDVDPSLCLYPPKPSEREYDWAYAAEAIAKEIAITDSDLRMRTSL